MANWHRFGSTFRWMNLLQSHWHSPRTPLSHQNSSLPSHLPSTDASLLSDCGTRFWLSFPLCLGGIPTSIVKVRASTPTHIRACLRFTFIKTFSALTALFNKCIWPQRPPSPSPLACRAHMFYLSCVVHPVPAQANKPWKQTKQELILF